MLGEIGSNEAMVYVALIVLVGYLFRLLLACARDDWERTERKDSPEDAEPPDLI